MGAGQSPNRKVKSTLGQLSWLNSAACTDTIGYCIQFNAHGFSVSRIFHLSNKQTNNRYLSQPDTCSNAWEYLEQEDNCGFSKCGNIALRARILQRRVFLIICCIVGCRSGVSLQQCTYYLLLLYPAQSDLTVFAMDVQKGILYFYNHHILKFQHCREVHLSGKWR